MNEKIGFFKALGLMWKNIFNYKGKANRREYWFPVLFNTIIIGIAVIMLILTDEYEFDAPGPVFETITWVLVAYLIISIIPFISLTVRRLHDAGKSGWWTCLLLAVGAGTIWVLLMCTSIVSDTGSVASFVNRFDPFFNMQENVYGPPPWDDYNPADNGNVDVYGPPEWFDSTTESEIDDGETIPEPEDSDIETTQEPKNSDFEPDDNTNEDVYGPPEWFGASDEPENGDFEPDDNEPVTVYGPPEWFN